jgi:CRISPR-associated protein Cas1
MALCADHGVAVNFLTDSGRLRARVDAPGSGNVLVRREQFRLASDPERCRWISAAIVAGKIHNSRNLLLRSARETSDSADQKILQGAAAEMAGGFPNSPPPRRSIRSADMRETRREFISPPFQHWCDTNEEFSHPRDARAAPLSIK